MLNNLSTGAEDVDIQRNLQAILAKGRNFARFIFQNRHGSSSCGKQPE